MTWMKTTANSKKISQRSVWFGSLQLAQGDLRVPVRSSRRSSPLKWWENARNWMSNQTTWAGLHNLMSWTAWIYGGHFAPPGVWCGQLFRDPSRLAEAQGRSWSGVWFGDVTWREAWNQKSQEIKDKKLGRTKDDLWFWFESNRGHNGISIGMEWSKLTTAICVE